MYFSAYDADMQNEQLKIHRASNVHIALQYYSAILTFNKPTEAINFQARSRNDHKKSLSRTYDIAAAEPPIKLATVTAPRARTKGGRKREQQTETVRARGEHQSRVRYTATHTDGACAKKSEVFDQTLYMPSLLSLSSAQSHSLYIYTWCSARDGLYEDCRKCG